MSTILDTEILDSVVLNPNSDSQSTRTYENLVYGAEDITYDGEEVVY
jgi:hypothetical protein